MLLGQLFLQSCLKLVSDEFPEFPKAPTVNAILRTGKPVEINLTYAGTIDSSKIEVIENAQIDLFVDQHFVQSLSYHELGNYQSTVIVEAEKEYQCIIVVPGFDTIRCRQYVPEITPVLHVEYIDTSGFDEEGRPFYAFKLTFPNDKGKKNYFEIDHKRLRFSEGGPPVFYAQSYMVGIEDPVFLNEGIERSIFSDELLNDSTYTIHYNFYRKYNRTICNEEGCISYAYPELIEFRSVSEDYYRYIKQLELYHLGRLTGFEGNLTAFPLYSNIENGYGIFAAYSYVQTDTIFPAYVH
jgi:hypothetical protein